mmetsp:Transcript_54947/g.170517  ORF Transcript_54947/g.170517 Transcript_54947/m.170517 type:complete len:330 (+) Transcript_54947:62-1051(+)|eukprot:CAMPEP_0175354878 /NCGR_PEP_ID=MMETSP0095-20121207/13184_1 /TAXON_ID=311494 /ORGANISM="Alexandrium monilatum, Strain CCMP3105" /LENGTH=329 /DNA_ID=CAMNT_0016652539 /DNA_START=59 /DNA_END=1048 /DNA_ORIENTATION=+
MFEEKESVNGVLQFINSENYGFRTKSRDVEELVVWGGVVANCAEDCLSNVVDGCSEKLRRVVYCPDRTKGGCLIRPKYHEGDRGTSKVFPQLTDLTIRLYPVLLPGQYGWITPSLRRLRLLCVSVAKDRARDGRGHSLRDVNLPELSSLQEWLGPELSWVCCAKSPEGGRRSTRLYAANTSAKMRQPLLGRLFQDCPELESVTIALCSTEDTSMTEVDWIKLLPPGPVPWSLQRLLLLPLFKPQDAHAQRAAGDEGGGEVETTSSPLSLLTAGLLQRILRFLGRSDWTCVDFGVPAEEAQRLELPAGFCEVSSLDVLTGSAASVWTQSK